MIAASMRVSRAMIVRVADGMQLLLASCIAFLFVVPIWIALLTGRITVRGYWRMWKALRRSGALIIVNHPSLLESFALPSLLWPWQFVGLSRCMPWSIADDMLLGTHGRWLYEGFHCIPISRREGSHHTARHALRTMRTVFERGGSIIAYPEGGRTGKGESFVEHGSRRVRECNPNAVQFAASCGAVVIPVWVTYGDCSLSRSILGDYLKLFTARMHITCGEPQVIARHIRAEDVAQLLLTADKGA